MSIVDFTVLSCSPAPRGSYIQRFLRLNPRIITGPRVFLIRGNEGKISFIIGPRAFCFPLKQGKISFMKAGIPPFSVVYIQRDLHIHKGKVGSG